MNHIFRDRIITEAMTWENTPFHRCGLVKGVGADCVAILWSIYRDVYGAVEGWPHYAKLPMPYQALSSQQWHCHLRTELLRTQKAF